LRAPPTEQISDAGALLIPEEPPEGPALSFDLTPDPETDPEAEAQPAAAEAEAAAGGTDG
jgi:hypothetical protein